MTFYVGVDIAKYEHVASILDSTTGEFLVDSLHFDNNLKGFNLFDKATGIKRNTMVGGHNG